ncbi:MAG TPA: toluene-4-monooxygenase system B family protein [Fibrobacteria bacterium]|nr:toluene-4-monooxygenase system B family protein [Fibrobacteria bacterium]
MLVPLYGFMRGDCLGLIVLVHDTDPVAHIAETLAQAAGMRVVPRPGGSVYADGKRLDPGLSVAQAGLTALDRVDVIPEEHVWPG